MRPISAAVLVLSGLLSGCAGTYDQSPMVMVSLEESPQLDSLIAGFRGDSLDHVFNVVDPRVLFAPCAGVDSGFWHLSLGTYVLELDAPSTVSVVLTDSTGDIRTSRHYFAEEPGTYLMGMYSDDYWDPADRRRFRFNVLIDGVLVLSC